MATTNNKGRGNGMRTNLTLLDARMRPYYYCERDIASGTADGKIGAWNPHEAERRMLVSIQKAFE